ncbi:glycosyltransferase [Cellulomonas hominis]
MHPAPVFDHLDHLSTPLGLFEHARYTDPRPEHGYCLDDVARGLLVTARQPGPSATVVRLRETYLAFTLTAQEPDGRFRNRRRADGSWSDQPAVADHWGRALWALGTTAACTDDPATHHAALDGATLALQQRSPWWHATAYAALGAAEVLRVRPGDAVALAFLADARDDLDVPGADLGWPWPEPRLTYANAVLPEALIAVGSALADDGVLGRGLALLRWLTDLEVLGGRLSPTPAGGWEPGERRPGFDQQPVEVTALAEACARACRVSVDGGWLRVLDLCAAWFLGRNDTGAVLYDVRTGGGRDGIEAHGVNQNQGAESTLAALATLQLARLLAPATGEGTA